jgi:hypothetical protein
VSKEVPAQRHGVSLELERLRAVVNEQKHAYTIEIQEMQDRFQRSRLSLEMKLLDSKTKEEMNKKEMHEMKQQLVQKDDQIILSTKKGLLHRSLRPFPLLILQTLVNHSLMSNDYLN